MFLTLKSLGGVNYLLPHRVLAITSTDPTKCTVVMEGGVMIAVSEPAKDVIVKVTAALGLADAPKES